MNTTHKLKLLFALSLMMGLHTQAEESNGLAPEVTDLNAADVSYALEKKIPDLKHPFISVAPKDRKDGIAVGKLDTHAEPLVRAFAKEIDKSIEVECIFAPPDPHPKELFCEWKFTQSP